MAVPIEIRHTSQPPASRKSWTVGGADENVVIQIPDRRLTRVRVVKHVVWLSVC